MVATANNLRGFRSTTLRVIVRAMDERYAWVVTADLLDVGTPLTLNRDQVVPEPAPMPAWLDAVRHKTGLVTLA